MVVGANEAEYKELVGMASKFEKLMEECGLAAKWEDRCLEKAVKKLRKYGMDPKEIARALELPLNTVSRYLNAEH
ncbi:MAG: hypothetical protein LBU00_08085, partial [Treponema sp.]|nr:hypothetical protein [Treponema sp.]